MKISVHAGKFYEHSPASNWKFAADVSGETDEMFQSLTANLWN
jgi:hypothetical protein